MKQVTLKAPAIINGTAYQKDKELTVSSDEIVEQGYKLAARESLRKVIYANVADPESMLGITADGVLLALIGISRLTIALSTATSLAEVRASALELAELSKPFIGALDAGQLETTLEVKPETHGEILNQVIGANVAVAGIIKSATSPEAPAEAPV